MTIIKLLSCIIGCLSISGVAVYSYMTSGWAVFTIVIGVLSFLLDASAIHMIYHKLKKEQYFNPSSVVYFLYYCPELDNKEHRCLICTSSDEEIIYRAVCKEIRAGRMFYDSQSLSVPEQIYRLKKEKTEYFVPGWNKSLLYGYIGYIEIVDKNIQISA